MKNIGKVELSVSWQDELKLIEDHIRQKSLDDKGARLQILEAGCGQEWFINIKDIDYVLTGVDLDKAALDIRKNVLNDLQETVQGDLRTVVFENSSFDVIYNAYVLEHIEGAEAVLKSFVRWLKPDGLLILHIPLAVKLSGFCKFRGRVKVFYLC